MRETMGEGALKQYIDSFSSLIREKYTVNNKQNSRGIE